MTGKFITALCSALSASIVFVAAAEAAECPRKDALGTSRILAVDAATSPRVGSKSFPQTLPLEDREVVLTFDDGPWPGTTPKVLAALAHECVRATFFLIGKPAAARPDMVRALAAQGHTDRGDRQGRRRRRDGAARQGHDDAEHAIFSVSVF